MKVNTTFLFLVALAMISATPGSSLSIQPQSHSQSPTSSWSRRSWIQQHVHQTASIAGLTTSLVVFPFPSLALSEPRFRTRASAEYTNSITASRDTNVSPKEAYDSILQYLPKNKNSDPNAKALDVGAGAGLSTSYLYDSLGYKTIDAVDWSGDAWRSNVIETPSSVVFYELDDDSFFETMRKQETAEVDKRRYQVICYNFAINPAKAVRVAKEHLADDGVLFAPVNDRPEYWYKQTYYVLNNQGQILQRSASEVGAWSVQFQPDVTSSTCTGIWCGDMNGFFSKRAQRQNS